jgi:cytochrome P450
MRGGAIMAEKYSLPVTSWFSGHLTRLQPGKLAFMEQCERQFPIGRFRIYHRPLFVVSDPELIGEVLVHRNDDFIKTWVLRTAARPLFGDGLVTSSGETWKRNAARMRPRFTPRQVDQYVPAIHHHTEALLNGWQAGDTCDIPLAMSHLTLRIACDTLFGVGELEVRDALLCACDASQAFYAEWERTYWPIPVLLPTRSNLRYRSSIRALDRCIYELIARRRRDGGARDGNIVAQLIDHRDADGTPMPDRAIRDELVTLFLAAYETTAAVLAWTIYLIGTRPDVEALVKAELARVLAGGLPGPEAAKQLPYLYNVLREALRLYPSIPILGRAAVRDTQIGDTAVPKGSEILISPWAVHRSARHYEDPLAFRPDRWTPAFERRLPRYAFIPFSSGARGCMGQHMAVQESMQILAMLMQFSEIRPVEGPPPILDAGMTAVPRHGTLSMTITAVTPRTGRAPQPITTH